jgi:hypothetical protein
MVLFRRGQLRVTVSRFLFPEAGDERSDAGMHVCERREDLQDVAAAFG